MSEQDHNQPPTEAEWNEAFKDFHEAMRGYKELFKIFVGSTPDVLSAWMDSIEEFLRKTSEEMKQEPINPIVFNLIMRNLMQAMLMLEQIAQGAEVIAAIDRARQAKQN